MTCMLVVFLLLKKYILHLLHHLYFIEVEVQDSEIVQMIYMNLQVLLK